MLCIQVVLWFLISNILYLLMHHKEIMEAYGLCFNNIYQNLQMCVHAYGDLFLHQQTKLN
jgi:hypothetical protein